MIQVYNFDGKLNSGNSWVDTINSQNLQVASGSFSWQDNAVVINNNNRFSLPTNYGSYGTFEVLVKISESFVPQNSTLWYTCSCLFGCELWGTQRDWGIVIDRNGYFAIGYSTSSIAPTSIRANDGNWHTVTMVVSTTSLVLYIDGTLAIRASHTMDGTALTSYGVGWNNADPASYITGHIGRIKIWSDSLTDADVYSSNVDNTNWLLTEPVKYVKYIESTGAQYINLNYTHKANTKVVLDCRVIKNTQRNWQALFGSRYKNFSNNAMVFFVKFDSNDIPAYNRSGYETTGSNFPYDNDIVLTCYQKDAQWVTRDGTRGSITTAGTADSGVAPLFLFDLNNAQANGGLNEDGSKSVMRVYSLKIYEDNTLVHNFKPCIIGTGIGGLWDEVEQLFHGNDGTGSFLVGDILANGKYLIRSGSTIYTVTDGVLTALSETELTSSLFLNSGFDSIPDSSLLVTLADPEVMFWTDGEDELPTLTATVTGTPFPQTVITNDVDMSDPTVLGIESVEISASDDVLFAMSFDGGTTWKGYINQWVTLETENSGMTAAQFRNIPIEAWAQQATTGHYMVRFILSDADSYVERITIHYIN